MEESKMNIKDMLESVELFNVGEIKETSCGYALHRFPENVYKYASSYGSFACMLSDHCEIRFVREDKSSFVLITLMAEHYRANIVEMRGDRVHKVHLLEPNVPYSIQVTSTALDNVKEAEFFKDDVYSKDVVRLISTGSRITVCGIETYGRKIRPPKKEELPQKTILLQRYFRHISFLKMDLKFSDRS